MRRIAIALGLAAVVGCRADTTTSVLTVPSKTTLDVVVPTPTESDAVAISQNIQTNHWPYLTLLNPRYMSGDPNSPDYMTLSASGYTQAADNAIWTGHYLAAESFRYSVTHSDDALANVRKALTGITALIDVTGTDLLARFLIPRARHTPMRYSAKNPDMAFTKRHIAAKHTRGLATLRATSTRACSLDLVSRTIWCPTQPFRQRSEAMSRACSTSL